MIKMTIVKRAYVAKDIWKWLISDNDAVQDLHYSWVLSTRSILIMTFIYLDNHPNRICDVCYTLDKW